MIKEIVVRFEDGSEKSFASFEEAIENTVGVEALPETEDAKEEVSSEETPVVDEVASTVEESL
jgi:hypothetical protein